MDVPLSPKMAEFVRSQIERGDFLSPAEVVEHALTLLEGRDIPPPMNQQDLRREITIGIEQADRGELLEGSEVFDRLRAKLRARPNSDA